jgi:hypothetical protein
VGVGNADAEVPRHTGTSGDRGHRRAPIRGKNSGRSYSNVNRRGVVGMSLNGSTDVACRRFWPGASPVEPVSYRRSFFDHRHVIVNSGPLEGPCSEVSDDVLRPVAAVECPGRKAKGRRGVLLSTLPTAGRANISWKRLRTMSRSASPLNVRVDPLPGLVEGRFRVLSECTARGNQDDRDAFERRVARRQRARNPDPASPAIMMSGQGPAYASNIQSLQGFARCNLQAKPEREERNAEMVGTGPPARLGVWERRVGAGLS